MALFVVGAMLMRVELASGTRFDVLRERFGAHAAAGFRAAQLHRDGRGRLLAEVVIVGDDPVHFGARKIQRARERRNGSGRHEAYVILNGVQDRDERHAGSRVTLHQIVRCNRDGMIHSGGSSKVRYALVIHKVCIYALFVEYGYSER